MPDYASEIALSQRQRLDLSGNLRAERARACYTQKQLAAVAGINYKTVQRMEYGQNVCADSRDRVEEALGVTLYKH